MRGYCSKELASTKKIHYGRPALFPKLSNNANLHNESADDVDNGTTARHFHKSPDPAIDRSKKECE